MFVAAFLIWMSSTNSPKIAEKTIYTKAVAIVFEGMWAKKLYFIVILGYSTPLISLRWNRLNNLPFFPMTFVNKCLYHVGQPVNISRPFVTEQWHWKIHKDTEIKRILWWSRGGQGVVIDAFFSPPAPLLFQRKRVRYSELDFEVRSRTSSPLSSACLCFLVLLPGLE